MKAFNPCEGELQLLVTEAFSVLHYGKHSLDRDHSIRTHRSSCSTIPQQHLPTPISLEDILLHESRQTTDVVRTHLRDDLVHYGFCILRVSNAGPKGVIQDLRQSLDQQVFPCTTKDDDDVQHTNRFNHSHHLNPSSTLYISEKGVPMYKTGYELCEDGVREIFRVICSGDDTAEWPCTTSAESFRRGLGLMRHLTDTALDLLLSSSSCPNANDTSRTTPRNKVCRRNRPQSGSSAWRRTSSDEGSKQMSQVQRIGDFSVLYAMHYFNSTSECCGVKDSVEPGVAVKAHVDPSLLVVEPFLCPYSRGLQVWDRINEDWMDCDGPNSPLAKIGTTESKTNPDIALDDEFMLMFAGKALAEVIPNMKPTLHRVVVGEQSRRTVIYEQKYEEFFPTPTFD